MDRVQNKIEKYGYIQRDRQRGRQVEGKNEVIGLKRDREIEICDDSGGNKEIERFIDTSIDSEIQVDEEIRNRWDIKGKIKVERRRENW